MYPKKYRTYIPIKIEQIEILFPIIQLFPAVFQI